MSIREVGFRYSNLQHLKLDRSKLPPGVENLCCEVYNRGKESILFISRHPEWARMNFFGLGPKFWAELECKPGEWVFLPHGLYIPWVPSGSKEIPVVINVGDAMFKGNKLPSRPEVKKMNFFT